MQNLIFKHTSKGAFFMQKLNNYSVCLRVCAVFISRWTSWAVEQGGQKQTDVSGRERNGHNRRYK